MDKTITVITKTVSVITLIINVVQIVEYGVDFYKSRVQKPRKVKGFSS